MSKFLEEIGEMFPILAFFLIYAAFLVGGISVHHWYTLHRSTTTEEATK